MTVNKITNAPTQNETIDKINEIIDNLGGGSATDVQINGTSITNSGVANIVTNSAYDASSNKIATMSDVKQEVFIGTKGTTTFQQFKDAYDSGMMLYALETGDTYGIYAFKRFYTASSKDIFEFTRTYRSSTSVSTAVWTFSSSGDDYTNTTSVEQQVQANWNETNTSSKAYIQNKPTIPTVPTNVSAFNNDAGYTTNVGTVTSVNNNQPDANGNVTLSIPDTSTLANTSLSNLTSTGNNLVNTTLDTNDNTTRLKFWTGTKSQYDAIGTKDSNTLYNITDDQDVTMTLLQTIYPVGSVYLSTNATCPLASLFGTWTLVSSGRALWTGTGSNGGSTIEAGLPNISGSGDLYVAINNFSGALKQTNGDNKKRSGANEYSSGRYGGISVDASLSNPIYGNSNTVQPPAYVVNVWRRTA